MTPLDSPCFTAAEAVNRAVLAIASVPACEWQSEHERDIQAAFAAPDSPRGREQEAYDAGRLAGFEEGIEAPDTLSEKPGLGVERLAAGLRYAFHGLIVGDDEDVPLDNSWWRNMARQVEIFAVEFDQFPSRFSPLTGRSTSTDSDGR